jgi:hypothetical protein
MKHKQTTTRELNRVVTSFTIYKFVKDITTPFEQLKAFKNKMIDADGNFIGDPKKITPYDRLIINLKKLLAQIPNPKIKADLKYLTTALVLFVEQAESEGADPDIVFNEISEILLENGINVDDGLTQLLGESNEDFQRTIEHYLRG